MTNETFPPLEDEPAGDEMPVDTADLAVVPAMGALADTEAARAIAQMQGLQLLARKFPRDEDRAMEKIRKECSRLSLAEKATYVYRRGDEEISGPTIRCAEVIVRAWGNLSAGVEELSRDPEEGVSMCRAYAFDNETGATEERKFPVRHWREVRGGKGYRLTSERDIRELIFNIGARNKRACIQAIVPTWVFEDAVNWCEQTVLGSISIDGRAIADLVDAFGEFGVLEEHICHRIRGPLHEITEHQMLRLQKIYNALAAGESRAADWFDVADVEVKEKKGGSLADIAARAEKHAAAIKPKPAPTVAAGTKLGAEIETAMREAKTLDELGAAMVKLGQLNDMTHKQALYELGDQRKAELKK